MSMQTVPVRKFPQLERRTKLSGDFLKSLYSRTINNEFFFRYFNRDYLQALSRHQAPAIPEAGERVVADMKRHGVAFADFTEIFGHELYEKMVAAFNGYRDAFLAERAAKDAKLKGKEVIIDTIHKSHHFVPDDAVSDYLSSPEIAGIAARYMGMVPRYVGSSFWHTKPAPTKERVYSQLWHRDYNDRRLVKFFLYLCDVGLENGYFEYVTGTHATGPLGKSFDSIGPDGYRAYPDQEAIDKTFGDTPVFDLASLPPEQRAGDAAPWAKLPHARILCTAKAGSLIFCDTFGVHRGGFIKEGYRDLIMGTYSTNFNVHKPHFTVSPEFADGLDPFRKMVFGVA